MPNTTMTVDDNKKKSVQSALKKDPNSVANIESFQTQHIHLDWLVNFEASIIEGQATLNLARVDDDQNPKSKTIKLDCSHLLVEEVKEKQSNKLLKFKHEKMASKFGGLLEIELENGEELAKYFEIEIKYKTTNKSSALQWLKPHQTIGKKHPYLFSQSQAIHARTMLPCQDSPAIKATYTADVRIASPLAVVMSANVRQEGVSSDKQLRLFQFRQTTPIPAYLIAIGAGALVSRDIGPRSAVWSEVEVVEAAAHEFAETETFIATGEKLVTPYVWGRYDILLLPPSFPYGGMENPCLTFLTPSLLAGDRSLVDVVAHEIAHSWTGNLVSCSNWEHFWLNEGFTMFLERKILSRIHGESWRQFNSIIGLADLRESVKHFGDTAPETALIPDLKDTDPDDVFSSIPYEKGYTLLYTLEELVGGPSSFEPFFKAHIEKFAGQSIVSDQFREFAQNFFADNPVIARKLEEFDWDKWFYGKGMPPSVPKYDDHLLQDCRSLATQWLKQQTGNKKAYYDFSPAQKTMFFDILMENASQVTANIYEELNKEYKMDECKNVEILLKWYLLGIRSGTEAIFEKAAHFATQHGRMKYCRPVYRELFRSGERGKRVALDTFYKNKEFYHPIASHMISKDLQLI